MPWRRCYGRKKIKQPEEKEPHISSEQTSNDSQDNDLAVKLAEAEKQLENYKDMLLRKAAEFDNYKKRVENESASIFKFARVDVITEILPVVDDFERSLKLGKEKKDSEAFYKGIELIYQKLLKLLESHGVRIMETVGKEFDVHYHDALLQVHRTDVPPHTIVEEVEKGYILNDRVLRHAKVIVSAAPADHESSPTEEAADSSNSRAKEN